MDEWSGAHAGPLVDGRGGDLPVRPGDPQVASAGYGEEEIPHTTARHAGRYGEPSCPMRMETRTRRIDHRSPARERNERWHDGGGI